MQLSYRGATYEYDPTPVDMVNSRVTGRYRGQPYNFSYPRHVPVPQCSNNLIYRGATYHTTETGRVEPIASGVGLKTCPINAAPVKTVQAFKIKPLRSSELEATHQWHIRQRLQQRIEAAKKRGDINLLRQLEQEMQQIA